MSIFSKSRGTTIRPRHYYDEKIVFVLGLFTILLPGFYQSLEATGKYFNAVSIFVQWIEFCRASV